MGGLAGGFQPSRQDPSFWGFPRTAPCCAFFLRAQAAHPRLLGRGSHCLGPAGPPAAAQLSSLLSALPCAGPGLGGQNVCVCSRRGPSPLWGPRADLKVLGGWAASPSPEESEPDGSMEHPLSETPSEHSGAPEEEARAPRADFVDTPVSPKDQAEKRAPSAAGRGTTDRRGAGEGQAGGERRGLSRRSAVCTAFLGDRS